MPAPVRSYRRIFRVDRRIYQIEGRQLPLPGGVPLRFFIWFAAAEITVIMLRTGALPFTAMAVAAGALVGRGRAGTVGAVIGAALGWAAFTVASFAIGLLSAPLAFFIVPLGIGVISLQAEPDGRQPHRFVVSWVRWQTTPHRRAAGRAVPAVGARSSYRPECWIAPDFRNPTLRKADVLGPTEVTFRDPIRVTRRRRGATVTAHPPARRGRRAKSTVTTVTVGAGETLKIRP